MHAFHLEQKTNVALPKAFHILKEDQKSFGSFGRNTEKVKEGEKRPIACVDCHGGIPNRAHQFSATDASCINCHQKVAHAPTEFQKKFGCRNCHFSEFLIEE